MKAYVHDDWRWEPSIGVRYGHHKGKRVAIIVHQPLMTSPWWTISTDDHREDFVRIFPHAMAAIKAAEAEIEGRPETTTLVGKVCKDSHGNEGNAATFYGHFGRSDVCVRVGKSDVWVYDVQEARA